MSPADALKALKVLARKHALDPVSRADVELVLNWEPRNSNRLIARLALNRAINSVTTEASAELDAFVREVLAP